MNPDTAPMREWPIRVSIGDQPTQTLGSVHVSTYDEARTQVAATLRGIANEIDGGAGQLADAAARTISSLREEVASIRRLIDKIRGEAITPGETVVDLDDIADRLADADGDLSSAADPDGTESLRAVTREADAGIDDDINHLRALVRRVADSLAQLVAAADDPGTEALSALYLARQVALPSDGIARDDERDAIAVLVGDAVRLAVGKVVDQLRHETGATWSPGQVLDAVDDDLCVVLADQLVDAFTGTAVAPEPAGGDPR